MKRLLVIPIMFIYLLAVSGVMISVHYCGSHMESWTMYAHGDGCKDDSCEKESGKKDKCCKDKVITAKVANEQAPSYAYKIATGIDLLADIVKPYEFYQETVITTFEKEFSYRPNAPPGRWQDIPLYKLHSGFIYYG